MLGIREGASENAIWSSSYCKTSWHEASMHQRIGLIVGPAHAAAALLANLFIEGTLADCYKEFRHGDSGLECLVRSFGSEGTFTTEIGPLMPGVIYQGGELGHSLAVAQGTVLDCPGSVVACFLGDGEAETGGIAGAWHGGRFLHPRTCGAVLPVVNLNGFKVGSASLFSQMSEDDLRSYLSGCGYRAFFVGPDHLEMHLALLKSLSLIQKYSALGESEPFSGPWPAIVLRTTKGWTGPLEFEGTVLSGTLDNHKTPLKEAHFCTSQMNALDAWLRSYKPLECFDREGRPSASVLAGVPPPSLRVGSYFVDRPSKRNVTLCLPEPTNHAANVISESRIPTVVSSGYLASVLRDNVKEAIFRVFSPDELQSCRFESILETSSRTLVWSSDPGAAELVPDGRIMEVLNEPLCLGWLLGYLANGGHGILLTYEAFAPILASMTLQYMRFLRQWVDAPWTPSIGSLNIVLTSLCWRNSYTHRNPDFLGLPLGKGFGGIEVYTPYDANALLASIDRGLRSSQNINLFVASKTEIPILATYEQAARDVEAGCAELETLGIAHSDNPDVVLAVCGDYLLPEAIAAIKLAKDRKPGLNARLVYVTRLNCLGRATETLGELSELEFENLFTIDKTVLFVFTGYPIHLKGLLFDRPSPSRFRVYGYTNCGFWPSHELLARCGVDRLSLASRLLEYTEGGDASKAVTFL